MYKIALSLSGKVGCYLMDITDIKIIEVLKQNGRATASEISKRVSLSVPAVTERIRKMEETGLIEGYTVRINRERTNYRLLAYIFVSIDRTENIEEFRDDIVKFNSVLECHHVVGEYDYLLKVIVEDTKSLEHFLSDVLKKVNGVVKSNTVIVLSTLKEAINL